MLNYVFLSPLLCQFTSEVLLHGTNLVILTDGGDRHKFKHGVLGYFSVEWGSHADYHTEIAYICSVGQLGGTHFSRFRCRVTLVLHHAA
jgi:hypothetical protein